MAFIYMKKEAFEEKDVIPNYAANIEKIILNCCKLSRENWILNAPPSRGKYYFNILNNKIIILQIAKETHQKNGNCS